MKRKFKVGDVVVVTGIPSLAGEIAQVEGFFSVPKSMLIIELPIHGILQGIGIDVKDIELLSTAEEMEPENILADVEFRFGKGALLAFVLAADETGNISARKLRDLCRHKIKHDSRITMISTKTRNV
jgi:hypothetical protein